MSISTSEVWVPFPKHEHAYEISSLGRVRSITRRVQKSNGRWQIVRGRLLTPYKSNEYYYSVTLRGQGKGRIFPTRLHRAMAEAFLPWAGENWVTCHKDESLLGEESYQLSNLFVGNQRDNGQDMVAKDRWGNNLRLGQNRG